LEKHYWNLSWWYNIFEILSLLLNWFYKKNNPETRVGLIDSKNGNEIIPLKYSNATDFENGHAKVRFDFPKDRNKVKVFSTVQGIEHHKAKGDWLLIDKTGTVID